MHMRPGTPRISHITESAGLALSRLSPRTKLGAIAGIALALALVPVLVTMLPAPSAPAKGRVANAFGSTGTTGSSGTRGANGSTGATGTAGTHGGTASAPTATSTDVPSGSDSGVLGGGGPSAATGCHFPLAIASVAFCDMFAAPAGTGTRAGDLNGDVWGVSHATGNHNGGQGIASGWFPTTLNLCGTPVSVSPPNDVRLCDGHIAEATSDGGTVTTLAMYPKQPFDLAGRTGTVVFDVSDDSEGSHAAWPEFWYTDQPVPAPFQHSSDFLSLPRNGVGIRLGRVCTPGQGGNCGPNCPGNNTQPVVSVDSTDVVTNYQPSQTDFVNFSDGDTCIVEGSASSDTFNHIEIRLNASLGVDVYGTDAFHPGSPLPPLKHLAHLSGPLPLTRGLIWLEDAHYNGNKEGNQGTHTFYWANVGFDGPVLAQDRAYDVLDHTGCCGSDGSISLGWQLGAADSQTLHTVPVASSALAQATGAALLYGFYSGQSGFTLQVSINGHAHSIAWPFPDGRSLSPLTYAYPIPLSDLVAGPNTITFSTDGSFGLDVENIDLVAIGGGGLP